MKNDLLKVGPFTVHGYGLMLAIGVLAAYLSAEYRAKKLGLEHEKIIDLVIWAALGGLLGAKILYCIVEIKDIMNNPQPWKDILYGFVVYGGIIGGILSGYLFCKKEKLEFLKYFDLGMPSVALAQGFGRIGCLLAGCCYGKGTDSAIKIVFHNSALAPNNVPLVPTQIISSGLDFLNCIVLILISKLFTQKKKIDGVIAGAYLIFYSIGRFFLEYYRGDLDRGSVGRFSTSQFISLFCVVFGIGIVIWRIKVSGKEAVYEEVTCEEKIEEKNED